MNIPCCGTYHSKELKGIINNAVPTVVEERFTERGISMKAIPSTDKCGHCNGNLKKYKTYYDARFRYYNSPRYMWGWICWHCWAWHGIGLGTGFGQEYDSKTDEKLRG